MTSMDNEKMYGKTIYNSGISDGVKEGILCPFMICNFNVKFINDENDDVVKIIKKCVEMNRKKIVIFHSNIEKSKNINKILIDNNFRSFHIDGDTSFEDKKKIIYNFKYDINNVTIINNIFVLKEGIDIKNIDCILFANKKTSQIDIMQSIGRGLRVDKNKNLLIGCVGYDNDEVNLSILLKNIILNDGYYYKKYKLLGKNINKIVKNININTECNNDDIISKIMLIIDKFRLMNLDEKLKLLSNYVIENKRLPNRTNDNKNEKYLYNFYIMMRCRYKNNLLDKNTIEYIKNNIPLFNLEIDNIEKINLSFEENMEMVTEYMLKNNKLPSKHSDDKITKHLGYFISNNKIKYNEGKIFDDKKKLMENVINFGNKNFDKNINDIKQFIDKKNNNVIKIYDNIKYYPRKTDRNSEENIMGLYLQRLREKKKNNKLDTKKIEYIEKIMPGFIWGYNENILVDNINKLKYFIQQSKIMNRNVETYGYPKQKSLNKEEVVLAELVKTFRKYKNKKTNNIITIKNNNEKIEQINKLFPDFIWNCNSHDDKINEFINFYKENNCVLPKKNSNGKEKQLYTFMQNHLRKKNNIDNKYNEILKEKYLDLYNNVHNN